MVKPLSNSFRQVVPDSDLLVSIHAQGHIAPFFFVHPVGGTVFCYTELARHLAPQQPFYGFQARGISGEAEPLTSISAMASCYLALVRRVQPAGPYYLGGWSLGGVIAFEMAQQLNAEGVATELLVMLDSHLPRSTARSNSDAGVSVDDLQMHIAFARNLGLSAERLSLSEDVRGSLRENWIAQIIRWARQQGSLPSDFDCALAESLFKVFKANYTAIWKYVPQSYPGRITYFAATEQGAGRSSAVPVWNGLARSGVHLENLPGDHYSVLNKTNSELLANRLRRCIAGAETRSSLSSS